MRYVVNTVVVFGLVAFVAGVAICFAPIPPMATSLSDEVGDLIRDLDGQSVPFEPALAEPNADEELLADIVATEMIRLDVFDLGFAKTREVTDRFLEFVKITESNGDRWAKAKTSTAMSLFQFTVPSVPTAVNRLRNYTRRHHLGAVPEWAAELAEAPKAIFHLSETRQAILTLVNIAEQKGSDPLLRQFFQGDTAAAKQIYFAHHHTDPDLATHRRVEKIFAKIFD